MVQLKEKTLSRLCLEASEQYGDSSAFALFQEDKICQERQITYKKMGVYTRQIARLLKQLGVVPGGRVLLFSENCPEWPLAYFGVILAGAVVVPLLPGFSPDQVQYIAGHSLASAVILSRGVAAKIEGRARALPLIYIDSLTEEGITVSRDGREERLPLPAADSLDACETAGEATRCKPEDLAVIIYTSGTQGASKGVMLSHSNIVSCVLSTQALVKMRQKDRLLSVLPLAHAYECTIGMLTAVLCGASICYLDRPPSPSVLLPAAKAIRPTLMATVPVFIEKIYRNAIAGKLYKNLLYRFPLTRPLAILVAGRKINAALGGKIRFFGIGGAPLAPEVEKFLRRARFPYAIGYGLTEAAPLIAGSLPGRFPLRSTGGAIRDVELRIATEEGAHKNTGEIQVRGPNVMMGYYHNEAGTRDAFTGDGWLRTGDLGYVNRKGQLYICGRIKALILGPSGENIYPEEIEGLLGSSSLIEDALVYLSEKGELIALVRLSEAAQAATNALEHTLEDLRQWTNKKLASFSRLSKIVVQKEPFEKTATMKIKRYLYIPQCQA